MTKEYKVGDTIYVKGTIVQIDENDHEKPYGIKFVYGDYGTQAWPNRSAIIDELPTAKLVKQVLPKEVADEMDLYKNAKCGLSTYLKDTALNTMETKATNKYLYRYMSDNSLRDAHTTALINAWNNGYTVEKEPANLVYVPGTNKKFVYNKRGDTSTRMAKLETPVVPSPVTSYETAYDKYKPLYKFTDAEITKFGLQDCERVEINTEE